MKHLVRNALVTVLGVGLVGCEWGGGGDDNSWNSGSGLANFSGTYRGVGGYLVSEYSTSSSSGGGGSSGELNVVDEGKGSTPGGLSFGGRSNLAPIKPGSFRLLLNGGSDGVFTDNGDGQLSGYYKNGVNFNTTGSISYDNGTYGVAASGAVPIPGGLSITINYTVLTGGDTVTTASGSDAGSSGVEIYAFNVQQEGNKIRIVDNNGSTYEGSLGSTRTTGGSDESKLIAGDQVMASFEISGRSKANYQVRMTGTFHGTIQNVSETTGEGGAVKYVGSLGSRTIEGTWIEDGGKTGDINGQAGGAAEVSATGTAATE